MAVLGRLLVSSAERLDLPDFLSIDSYTQGDFKYLLKSFVGDDKPFILKGFDVINPGNAIGTQNVSIRVADSVVYYPGSLAGPFFYGLEEGNTQAAPLVPELRKNATNYVYLTLTTSEAAKDTRAFWDPDKEGGDGGEFTQDVNTQTVLSADINVSASSFPENTIPVAIIEVGANFITSIQDARDMMFRLGSGGLNPDPLARYDWRDDPTAAHERSEPNTIMTNALDPNPFQGGDKNIENLKEWMDAIMTKLAELGGTTYWYEDTSVFNIINVFKDALTTSIKSKGLWSSSSVTPGMLTWSEDILLQSTSDLTELIIRDGNKTLADNEVMYIDRVRDVAINTGSISVEWFNAVNHVNGQLGAFENLSKGDWVKKADDNDNLYLRVEEFYAAANKGGGVTAPGSALSIKLSANYTGVSETKQGIYIKGVYLASEVDVADRASSAIEDAAGNYYWIAMRSDTILNVSDITTTQLSLDITAHDGLKALVTSVAHGLSDGQKITIAGSTNFDGTYAVSVETANTFYIDLVAGPHADELTQAGFYATITTAVRTTDDGLQLESASHGLTTNQRVVLSGTTNYNGDFQVFPTGTNLFTIPVSSLIATESAGVSTVVNIYVRTDIGPTKLERGENKAIGEADGANLMSFIGMDNDAQTYPDYYITPNYNTIDASENYNASSTDNLTQRVSKLTAMIADKAQDKTIKITLDGIQNITNTTNGAAQDITFVRKDAAVAGVLTAIVPSSIGNAAVTIDAGFSLNVNQVAYFSIDRNTASALTISGDVTVVDIDSLPLDENVFVLAFRLADTDVSLWDGSQVNDFQNALGVALAEVTTITNVAAASITTGQYFTINSASDATEYYVWFNKDAGGGDPTPAGKTAIPVAITTGDTDIVIGGLVHAAINALGDFNSVDNADGTVTVTNAAVGATTDAANVDVGGIFSINVDTPGFGEILHYLADGDTDLTALKKLDQEIFSGVAVTGALTDIVRQNRTLKLIEGGTWSWDLGTTTLTWSSAAQIQIASITDARNNIVAASASLTADGDVAYVSVNRTTGPTTNLTVTVAQIDAITLTDDIVIIARRVGSDVVIGNSLKLIDTESASLYATSSDQSTTYNGQTNTADSDPNYTSSPANSLVSPNFNTVNGEDLTVRLAKITSMLADIKQDLNIEFDAGTLTWDGTNITVTSAFLSIAGTTIGAGEVSINNLGSTALVDNSALYVDISRTLSSALTLASGTLASLTPSQQRLILIRNINGNLLVR